MIIHKINKNNISSIDIDLIVDFLLKNKVVVLPTDTIYGLHCLATSKIAINKIKRIKKRPFDKPFLILTSSLAMLKRYCYVSKTQQDYLKKVWSKSAKQAVTVILNNKKVIYKNKDTVAARLPYNELLLKIIRKAGQPLVSTSLNISGKINLDDLKKISSYFAKDQPDLVIDTGKLANIKASIIINITSNKVKTVRK